MSRLVRTLTWGILVGGMTFGCGFQRLDELSVVSVDECPQSRMVFYVPHAGDEARSMALSIAEAQFQHRHVKVILYTTGNRNLRLRDLMNGEDSNGNPVACPLHDSAHPEFVNHEKFHDFQFTLEEIETLREKELERSLESLGVSDYEMLGWQDTAVTGDFEDPFTQYLKNVILEEELTCPGTMHRCVSGPQDCRPAGRSPDPAHIACFNAARELLEERSDGAGRGWDFEFFEDYVYADAVIEDMENVLSYRLDQYLGVKQRAISEYETWDPEKERYALAYHVDALLFDRSKSDGFVRFEPVSAPSDVECSEE